MAFIDPISDEAASGVAAELFQTDRARLGYVSNYTRVFARRPEVFAAWRQLVGAVAENMDDRRYELATIAAARRLRSSYCTLAHGKVLADRFLAPAALRDIVVDHHAADLDELDVAIMDLAEKVVQDATAVIPADIERLRELGLADDEILDVVLAAAARCFFAKTLDALCVQPDAAFASLEPELRDALTVGRPIATASS
jgi:uncharacterized peroxidase-related enzyme